MKTTALTFLMVFVFSLPSLFAQEKTEEFKVYGNCGMCENRIEKAAQSVEGVSIADWDQETEMIEVTFDPSKTDLHKIHEAIADAGHDTDMHQAKDKTYDDLPGCCHYDRPVVKKKTKVKEKE